MKNLSAVQESIWLTQNIYAGSSLYNVGGYAIIEGELDESFLICSIEEVLTNADAIETGYYAFNDIPLNDNAVFMKWDISGADLSDTLDPDRSCLTWMQEDMREKFDVTKNLLKVRVLRSGRHRYYWYVKAHHLIFDGYSMSLFFNAVSARYSMHLDHTPEIKDAPLFSYASFIEDDRIYRLSDEFMNDRAFWLDRLKSVPGAKAFQSCLTSINTSSLFSRRKDARIPRKQYDQIAGFCDTHGCTAFHYFIAVLIILNRIYNNEAAAIGIPVFNRRNKRFKHTIGTFVNVLPFYIQIDDHSTFIDILYKVKAELKDCFKHQRFSLYDILNELGGKGNIYNIIFSYQKNSYEAKIGDLGATISYIHNGEQEDDLVFHLLEYSETEDLTLSVDYREGLFPGDVIGGLLDHFCNLLFSLFDNPYAPVAGLEYLSEKEQQQLGAFNDTKIDLPEDLTIVDLFERQVGKRGDDIAVFYEGVSLTYTELNKLSNQLGRYLRMTYDIQPDDLIGIKLDRSEWLVIAILAVLKAGAAYVPIDPEYPQERIDFITSDSRCKVVVDEKELDAFKINARKISNRKLKQEGTSGNLVYVIYTSGSTGRPKGCMLEHRGVINRIEWMWQLLGFATDDIILQKTTFTFDVSVWELLMPLCWGATMVLCRKEDIASPERILALIETRGITCLHFVPGMLTAFITSLSEERDTNRKLKSLRRVITSGEALLPETVRSWYDLSDIPIYNLYGPTEASIDVTYYVTSRGDSKIPIGRPIWNTQMYIVGKSGQLMPVGVMGEICIGGIGLARGYLNKAALSAEKFVANPFREGTRMYKTGDLGRWLPDGNIEFIGREDGQVKIRGYRIELGEIENVLQGHPDIDAAAVIAGPGGNSDKELTAYLVGKGEMNLSDIRGHMRKSLPGYMIPGRFVQVEKLPLTSSGKVDKKRLLYLEGRVISGDITYIPPRNITEEKLVLVWKEVLGIEKIGVKDDFFDLGGHSLKATRLTGLIHKGFNVRISLGDLFSMPVLEDQALFIMKTSKKAFTSILPADKQAHYPLSSSQRRLWILSQFKDGNIAYNMPGVYVLEGELDQRSMERSFNVLIARHEILRTVFKEDEQASIRQFIYTPEEMIFRIAYNDARNAQGQDEMIKRLILEQIQQPFDLSAGPLLRAALLQVSDTKWIFIYVMHHIISDGWSMGILIRELLSAYDAQRKGEPFLLPALQIHYKDYASWQQEQLNGEAFKDDRAWWLAQFEGGLPVLELPVAKSRPIVKTYNGGIIRNVIDKRVSRVLKDLCQEQGGTLFMGLLAGVYALLYRYTGQKDIIIGSPIAGREHIDLEDQLGFYVNTLPLRLRSNGNRNFKELIRDVRAFALEAYRHQSYPFDELLNELDLRRDTSRNALFDVMVILQEDRTYNFEQQSGKYGVRINKYDKQEHITSKLDLTFMGEETTEGLEVNIEYNKDIYSEDTVVQLGDHLQQLLGAMVQQPSIPIDDLDYLNPAELHQISVLFNDTTTPYPKGRTVVELFEEQAGKTPDQIALVAGGTSMTYQELNEYSNQLARYLRKRYKIKPDDLVSIQLERNEWMIIAILGTLKSGGAYVPVDPEYPLDRIRYIREDSQSKVLIDEHELQKFQKVRSRYRKEGFNAIHKPGNLAYVMYTSGSTGHPKGVMIEHGSVAAFISWCKKEFRNAAFDTVLGVTSICFDLSVFEIFYTLAAGRKLRLLRNALDIPHHLNNGENLLLNTVPGVVGALLNEQVDLTPVKVLNMAGEPIPPHYIAKLDCRGMEVRNLYGPSEDTTYSTVYRLYAGGPVLIGRPISNTAIYILSEGGKMQPVGVAGEICISGAGLARGYLNRPGLTEEKFVGNPFRAGERMYRTGDLGRWLPDGNIEFIGRVDDQVKVRGYRIEPGEIEKTLQTYPEIESCAVLAGTGQDGDKELVAYIVSKDILPAAAIRSYLGKHLPSYMLPGRYVQVGSLPLTASGKIDRKTLSNLQGVPQDDSVKYVAPRNATEERLALIWQEVLGRDKIGIKDDFFESGGHSLKAIRLTGRIHKVFGIRPALNDLFTKTVLEDQARLIMDAPREAFTRIPAAGDKPHYPLSSSQRRLWLLSQFEEANIAYNMMGVYVLEGILDLHALERSFNTLIDRHEILRTVFKEDEQGEVRQFIIPMEEHSFRIAYLDVKNEQEQEGLISQLTKDRSINKTVKGLINKPFDLSAGPLLRAALLQVSDAKWIFVYVMHHIISDGWSMDILIRELQGLYNAYTTGQPHSLSPLQIHYKDYASWQRQQLEGDGFRDHKAWWLKQFEGELPVLELPADKARPAVKTYRGHTIYKTLRKEVCLGLKTLCHTQEITLFMGLLGGVYTLLHRYTGQSDIIIGSPIAGREHMDLEDQIGFYVNTIALRIQGKGENSFEELTAHIKQVTLGAYQHQSYPFDELVHALDLRRDTSRSALFDVMVVLQNEGDPVTGGYLGKMKINEYEGMTGWVSKFDLNFQFAPAGEEIQTIIEYNTDIYNRSTIVRLADHLEQLLEAIILQPSIPLGRLDFLADDEKQRLLTVFNDTAAIYPREKTLVDLFEEQVRKWPDRTALVFEGRSYSYGELGERSGQLAGYLRERYEVMPDDLVGVRLERSEWMIITLLGILRSGGAYVPVDPEYPQERVDYIMEDSRCRVLIDEVELERFRGLQANYSREWSRAEIGPGNLAYVIYTSGSTGRPKGCMLEYGGVVNRLAWMWEHYGFTEEDVILQKTTFTFDVSVWELFLPLCWGARMVLCRREDIGSPERLLSLIEGQGVTCLHFVPGMLNAFIGALFDREDIGERLKSLRRVITSGEALPVKTVMDWYSRLGVVIHNLYGPTEASVDVSYYATSELDTRIPIGRPIWNTQLYIMGRGGQLQPMGVVGEIGIGGDGLARGYLNRPELTEEKFVGNPFRAGERMYRTGDLGRWLPDGNIEFIGRVDDQVKVRGYRIELGEIEKVLSGHPMVAAAVVVARPNQYGEKELVAYITGKEALQAADLRAYLGRSLPAYMVPGQYVQLEELPVTSSGKVDRRRLPAPEGSGLTPGAEYIAPRNEMERKFVAIWEKHLGREKIGIRDSFFDLGGDSIKVLRVKAELRKELALDIPVTAIYKNNTIEDIIADVVQNRLELEEKSAQLKEKEILERTAMEELKVRILESGVFVDKANIEDIYQMSAIEKGMLFGSILNDGLYVYHDQFVYRQVFADFDIRRFERAMQLLVDKHPALRTSYNPGDLETEVRIVHKKVPVRVQYKDISTVQREQQEDLLRDYASDELQIPFDISLAPLWRMTVFDLGRNELAFVWQFHHAILDGWSNASFITELNNLYLTLGEDSSYKPEKLQATYKDFIVQHQIDQKDIQVRSFWERELSGHSRLDLFSTEDTLDRYSSTAEGHLLKKIEDTAAALNTTVRVISLCAYLYMLKALNYDSEILIGLVTNTRPDCEDGDKVLGCFLNSVPLKAQVEGGETCAGFISRITKKLVELKDYERMSLSEISRLHIGRKEAGNPFFDVLFNFVDFHIYRSIKNGSDKANLFSGWERTNTYLDCTISLAEGQYNMSFTLTKKLVSGFTIEKIAKLYSTILNYIVEVPGRTLNELELIDPSEKKKLLTVFNDTAAIYPREKTLVDLFEEQVRKWPDRTALVFEGRSYSYGELGERSGQLAGYLRERYEVMPDDLVGVRLERSEWMIITLLGILRSGGAYVPVDPEYPQERVDYIMEDSRCRVLIDEVELERFRGLQANYSREWSRAEIGPGNLAYVIYTSGSTGRPKGCMLEYGGVVNRLAWMWEHYGFTEEDVILQKTTFTFDVSVWELFLPLCWGARMVLCRREDIGSPERLLSLIEGQGVTCLHFVPGMLNAFIGALFDREDIGERLKSLRRVITSGEALPVKTVMDWYSRLGVVIHNLYGPTEASVDVSYYATSELDTRIPIGRPIWNTQLYIMGRGGQLQPMGVVGEIGIGGDGLARGYLNRPELTEEKFVGNPFRAGERMYRTGDLGRWLPDGNIEFIGRVDDQVKVRGYRIELGEIEKVLSGHPMVAAAVVVARPNQYGEKELVAYITGKEALQAADLRAYLGRSLPAYMVPGQYVQLEELPVTSSGKVDRRRLPAPEGSGLTSGAEYIAPRNTTEEKLAAIWREILGKEKVGIKDDFFESGGHSLKAIRLVSQVQKVFDVKLTLRELYSDPTIESMATDLDALLWVKASGHTEQQDLDIESLVF